MVRLVAYLMILFLIMTVAFTAKGANVLVWEGFEKENVFRCVDWENAGRAELSIAPNYYSEGTRSLKVDFKKSPKEGIEKIAFYKEAKLDLSNSKVILDIYNISFYNLEVALGFDTGRQRTYYETIAKSIKRGWNKDIAFDLGTYDFKSKETNWEYSAYLKDANVIRRLFILIYYPSDFKAATIYVDNIRFKTD